MAATTKPIGRDIDTLGDVGTGNLVGGGYDHNWCLNGVGRGLHPCARVVDPRSGRGFELHTNEPGVQFYTGGYLDETVIGKRGKPYCQFAGYTGPATGTGCAGGTYSNVPGSHFFVSNNGQFKLAQDVPEPGSLALFGMAILGAGLASRKRKQA